MGKLQFRRFKTSADLVCNEASRKFNETIQEEKFVLLKYLRIWKNRSKCFG